ncbi:leucine-rich repeat domain-containing protein [Listeria grandensis]|uniref:leucine-rich repeat domain-containing protein n=1 Tax=Listeria grandensis TaxID=1494963 RepID=UPI00164E93C9|nr:leucine-rich repeat domain-containing protein [Listeria grandensis]MBC6316888.1 hypothetical protein [Listeria grandensis]
MKKFLVLVVVAVLAGQVIVPIPSVYATNEGATSQNETQSLDKDTVKPEAINGQVRSLPAAINAIFPDANLAAAVATRLKKQVTDQMTREDAQSITRLVDGTKNISNISGLEYLTELKTLRLEDNETSKKLSDLEPLDGLTKLEYLWVINQSIEDISPLSGLTKMKTLILEGNNISDLRPLSGLTNLELLWMGENKVTDISPLASLSKMSTLLINHQKQTVVNRKLNVGKPSVIPSLVKNTDGSYLPITISDGGVLNRDSGDITWNLSQYRDSVSYTYDQVVRIGNTYATFNGSVRYNNFIGTINSVFPDSALAEAIAKKLGKQVSDTVTEADLRGIKSISSAYDLNGKKVSDISGVEYLTGASSIKFTDCQISDVSPLRNLTQLTTLDLNHNEITDIEPLKGLVNLTLLGLRGNYVHDLDAVKNMKDLELLVVSLNNITDLSPLKDLSKLVIAMGDQRPVKISANLTVGREFTIQSIVKDVNGNYLPLTVSNGGTFDQKTGIIKWKITDAATELSYDFNQMIQIGNDGPKLFNGSVIIKHDPEASLGKISTLFPDAKLANLVATKLNKQVSDQLTQADVQQMTTLEDTTKSISDIRGLEYLTELKDLRLESPDLKDLTPIKGLVKLELLWIVGIDANFDALKDLVNIKNISFGDGSNIKDLSVLAKMKDLEVLSAANAAGNGQLEDLSPISGLTKLHTLYLNGNKISDLRPLSGLTNVQTMRLAGNMITDLSPLAPLRSVREATLNDQKTVVKEIALPVGTPIKVQSLVKGVDGAYLSLAYIENSSTFNRETGWITWNLASPVNSLQYRHAEAVVVGTRSVAFSGGVQYNKALGAINTIFPDENLAKVIAAELNKQVDDQLTRADVQDLTKLVVYAKHISNLKGLEYLTELKDLRLQANKVSDLTPIEGLVKLEYLWVEDEEISDLSPLSKLTNLTHLFLENNKITDISPLANLNKVSALTLNNQRRIVEEKSLNVGTPTIIPSMVKNTDGSYLPLTVSDGGVLNSGTGAITWNLDQSHSSVSYIYYQTVKVGTANATFNGSVQYNNVLGAINTLFPDAKLAAVIAAKLNKQESDQLTGNDVRAITELNAEAKDISDIRGLEYLTELAQLTLKNNKVSDLTPIKGLVKLSWLNVRSNEISNLKPLSGLTKLSVVIADENNISDLQPLSGLVEAGILWLADNNITDLSPLENLDKLYSLVVYNQRPVELSAKLIAGREFTIQSIAKDREGNYLPLTVSNGGTFDQKTGMIKWQITSTMKEVSYSYDQQVQTGGYSQRFNGSVNIKDEVEYLGKISTVFPDLKLATWIATMLNKQESDTVTLTDLAGIKGEADLSYSHISNITGLEYLTGVSILALKDNKISDVSPLRNLTQLTSLDLDLNAVEDIGPLRGLVNLRHLALSNNEIRSLDAVKNMKNLSSLIAPQNYITDLSPLRNLDKLDSLVVYNQKPVELSAKLTAGTVFATPNRVKGRDGSDLPITVNNGGTFEQYSGMILWPITDDMKEVSYSYDQQVQIGGNSQRFNGSVIIKGEKETLGKISTVFPDAKLATFIATLLLKQESDTVTRTDLAGITGELNLSYYNIGNISGLEYLTGVSFLDLQDNKISDVSPLRNLTQLTSLDLDSNAVEDIEPLRGLVNLRHLVLGNNKIRSLDAVKNMQDLSTLIAPQNYITDLSPLSSLITNYTIAWLDLADQKEVEISGSFIGLNEFAIQSIVKGTDGEYLPLTVGDGGSFNWITGMVTWPITNGTKSVSYSFDKTYQIGNGLCRFNGAVRIK